MNDRKDQFLDVWAMVLATIAETIILIPSLCLTFIVDRRFNIDWVGTVLLFYGFFLIFTFLTLKFLRTFFPMKEGIHLYSDQQSTCYIWNLYGFLCVINLSPFYNEGGIIPPPLKKIFYRFMGGKFGKGIIVIGGKITDPHLVTVESEATIGDGAIILPHILSNFPSRAVILGKIHIKRNAMIGVRTILLPGVTVGENSMVNSMSVVPMNTQIPDNEVWGGIPAKKIKSVV